MLRRRTLFACLLVLLLSSCATMPGGLMQVPGMPPTQVPPVTKAMATQPSPADAPTGQDQSRTAGAESPLAMAADEPATLDPAGSASVAGVETPAPASIPTPKQQSGSRSAGSEPSPASTVMMPANLRAGPGLHYAVVGSVEPGDILTVIACNPDRTWYELSDGRWIFSDLVANAPRALQVESHIPTPPGR